MKMAKIYYIKWWDPTADDCGGMIQTEFFVGKSSANDRRKEILKRIADEGGSDHSDIYYKGGIGEIFYKGTYGILPELEKLNEIYTT